MQGLFLEAGDGSDAPFPVREGCRVTPLIESAEMYPRLEREILKAKHSVWFAFRVLDPTTKLRSEEARAAGHDTWLDLIADALDRGVEIRILLTDFEPVLADYLHAGSWGSFTALQEKLADLPEARRSLFQMIVIQHEGEIGWGWRQFLRLALRKRVRRLVDKLLGQQDRDDRVFETRPGLWRWLDWHDGRPHRWKSGPPPRLWPATYHQKCAVIDGKKATIGGLDLDERRWDDSDHDQAADENWHDVSSLVEGPIVADVARHFVDCWNRELPRFREIVQEWTTGAARELTLGALDEAVVPEVEPTGICGQAVTQLVLTRSRKSGSVFATGPLPDIRQIEAAHRKLIGVARNRIYIEAQFFRSKKAAGWAIEALENNPGLELIILIANVPEEIAFLGQRDQPVHKHGEHLQARALGQILRAGGADRVGLFTLTKLEEITSEDRKLVDERGIAYGSSVIHIHAKLLIADRAACLMSSANINGRSFEWDTELGYLWQQDDGAIGAFRDDLWTRLSDGHLPPDATLSDWHHIAEHNRTTDREGDRKGFIVPYQRSRARRFGNPYWWIPDSIV